MFKLIRKAILKELENRVAILESSQLSLAKKSLKTIPVGTKVWYSPDCDYYSEDHPQAIVTEVTIAPATTTRYVDNKPAVVDGYFAIRYTLFVNNNRTVKGVYPAQILTELPKPIKRQKKNAKG